MSELSPDRQKLLNNSEKTGFGTDFNSVLKQPSGNQNRILPLSPQGHAGNGSSGIDDMQAAQKKKRCVIISAVVTLVLIALIIIIVVATKGSGGDSPDPGPNPPLPGGGVNPYYLVDDGSYSVQKNKISGTIGADQSQLASLRKARNLQSLIKDDQQHVGLLDPLGIPLGNNNPLIEKIHFEVGQAGSLLSYVHLDDAENARFSPGEDILKKPMSKWDQRIDGCGLSVSTDPFSFSFTDTRNQSNVLLHTKDSNFYMTDKYLQLDMQLPSQRIYGLGERNREFALGEGTWTMWANGQETPYDDGSGGKQTYGVHPFALVQSGIPGQFFGIFFRNANAMSPVIKHKDDGGATLSYITTGGSLDIYFFWKGSAKEIIKNYHSTFGTPSIPPMWALGWHAASRDYKSQEDFTKMITGYNKAEIPLEGIWFDVAYLDQTKDFSVNTTDNAFPDLATFRALLNTNDLKLMVTVNPGLLASTSNNYYNDAQQDQLLIKSSINTGLEFEGAVTTSAAYNHTVFLDFFNDKSATMWEKGLKDLFNQVQYDGLWFDMNEPTARCNGECPSGEQNQTMAQEETKRFLSELSDDENSFWYQSFNDQQNISTYDLPFIPGKVWNLDNMSLSLNATHPESNYSEYNVHSLFGHMQAMKTKEFLDGNNSVIPGKRTFMLSRSTFAGSGAHTQHQLGENFREWSNMTHSIASIMNFNMFGIPVTGPDTCGFYGETSNATEELCARWIQLASFYPFARQNKAAAEDGGGDPNEPYNMNEIHQAWVKNALQQRLQFARQFYSCLYEASQEGGTCFDPIMFHYPTDEEAFTNIEHSFIFANALKITPVLDADSAAAETIKSYFPKGSWVNMNDYSDIVVSEGGADGWKNLTNDMTNMSMINTHLMPGAMVIKQEGTFMTTADLDLKKQANNLTLIANRDQNGAALGKIYIDDGVSASQTQARYEIQLSANSIKKWQVEDHEDDTLQAMSQVKSFVITNAEDLNGTDFACITSYTSNSAVNVNYVYDEGNKTLTLSQYSDDLGISLHDMKDIIFGDSSKPGNLQGICSSIPYRVKGGEQPDLSGPTVTFQLESCSSTLSKPDLNMTLSILKTGVINVFYTFSDESLYERPFEVPTSIVDPKRNEISEDAKLSDYMQVNNIQGPFSLVFIYNGAMFHRIDDILLLPHVNNMDTISWTHQNDGGMIDQQLFGLFPRTAGQLYMDSGYYSMWARDIPNQYETIVMPGTNGYGTHPFYYGHVGPPGVGPHGDFWYGIYLNNAAATDYWVTVDTDTEQQTNSVVKSRAAGGLGDIYILISDTNKVENLIKKYHNLIVGNPVLIPQWALGWNQCKWGYENTDDLRWNVGNYSENDLPLDTQWNDIDWMQDYRDFTVDPDNFADLGDFVDELHDKHMRYVPILDAGIAQREDGSYEAYMDGKDKDIFIKNGMNETFTGRVWPNDAVYPDWFHNDTSSWWSSWLTKLQEQVKFDGLWLDMNEASNFCVGDCYDNQRSESPMIHQLPYIPSGRNMEIQSISLDATHSNGVKEVDAHSLFGSMEVKATNDWFQAQEKRTFIIERSSFSGMGKYGSMWLGDNYSTQESMAFTAISIMANNVMGIPMVGADICGFIGNTTAELCARWHMLGAFYPFSRNHNGWDTVRQEPYIFAHEVYKGSITYMDIMRKAIRNKYSLIRYYYTEMSIQSQEGGVFIKPLYFRFTDDGDSYDINFMQYNFLLGDALKAGVSNKLGQNTTTFYFPPNKYWCDLLNPQQPCLESGENSIDFPSYAWDSYCWLISGHIVPWQDAHALKAMNTWDLQQVGVDFIIHPQCDGDWCSATGRYLNDDGEILNTDGNQNRYEISYNSSSSPTPPDTFTVTFNHTVKASNMDKNFVNMNDALASIQLVDAQRLFQGQNYTVSQEVGTGSSVGNAIYNQTIDRLVWTLTDTVNLPDLSVITFTKGN